MHTTLLGRAEGKGFAATAGTTAVTPAKLNDPIAAAPTHAPNRCFVMTADASLRRQKAPKKVEPRRASDE